MNTEKILIDLTDEVMKLADSSSKEAKRLNSTSLGILAGQEIAKIDAYMIVALKIMEKLKGLQNV